jgi:hypothetical protein
MSIRLDSAWLRPRTTQAAIDIVATQGRKRILRNLEKRNILSSGPIRREVAAVLVDGFGESDHVMGECGLVPFAR